MPTDIDPFRRDPGGCFDDHKKEQYAQARAKGGNIKSASTYAGCDYRTAMKWERHSDMKARISELRQGADTFIGVSVGWVIGELKKNVEEARNNNQLKSSNEALKIIYEIVTKDPDVAKNVARALPANASIRDVKKGFLEARMAELPEDTGAIVIDAEVDNEEEEELVSNG